MHSMRAMMRRQLSGLPRERSISLPMVEPFCAFAREAPASAPPRGRRRRRSGRAAPRRWPRATTARPQAGDRDDGGRDSGCASPARPWAKARAPRSRRRKSRPHTARPTASRPLQPTKCGAPCVVYSAGFCASNARAVPASGWHEIGTEGRATGRETGKGARFRHTRTKTKPAEYDMNSVTDVAIVGAGPYGLSLAAQLRARGVDYRIFGRALDTWRSHMPKGMVLKSDGFASNLSSPGQGFHAQGLLRKAQSRLRRPGPAGTAGHVPGLFRHVPDALRPRSGRARSRRHHPRRRRFRADAGRRRARVCAQGGAGGRHTLVRLHAGRCSRGCRNPRCRIPSTIATSNVSAAAAWR